MIFDTYTSLSAILSPFEGTQRRFQWRLPNFVAKNLLRWMLEATKDQVPQKEVLQKYELILWIRSWE